MWSLRHLHRILVLLETRFILLFPDHFAVSEIDRGDDLLRIAAAVHEDASASDDGRRVAFADLYAPRAVELLGPGRRRVLLGHEAVAGGTAPLRPLLRADGRGH